MDNVRKWREGQPRYHPQVSHQDILQIAKIVNKAHEPHAIRADTMANTACNIPHIAMIVNQPHKQHTILEDTEAYTSCNIPHLVKSVNQSHKHHATRADTTAYTEQKVTEAEVKSDKSESKELKQVKIDVDKSDTKLHNDINECHNEDDTKTHIAIIVNKPHKQHATRADTTAYHSFSFWSLSSCFNASLSAE